MKNIRFYLILLILFVLIDCTNAQNNNAKHSIKLKSNVPELKEISKKENEKYKKNKKLVLDYARQNNIPIFINFENGFAELQELDENHNLIYYVTHNKIASNSVSTNKISKGGSSGLDLDGTDMIIGEWDGGPVLGSHQEFNNTGTSRVISRNGTSNPHYHATHVAGTLIAAGIDELAKGMAPNAKLLSYDWNDDHSEMAYEASEGLLISNHSYGTVTGWGLDGSTWVWYGNENISSQEDYRFGFYNGSAATLDDIAINAPYYLIVKSAGNDRGDGYGEPGHPADGGSSGFDCLASKSTAKNILTVGAVFDLSNGYTGNPEDVNITSFSSYGPCDDGRIKPDICGNGAQLYSAYNINDQSYSSMSGTSMSSPNVAGSLLLLQEHYYELYSEYLKSATLKGLVIHTANECGEFEGPDYKFGWGLLNSEFAAAVISNKGCNSVIEEITHNGSVHSFDVYSQGDQPLIVTISWTDPAGTPVSAQLDPPDLMLVNDLDLTVFDGTTTYYPYVLDPLNPHYAPTKGDNDIDNVEKIFIENPTAGMYTITVGNEGAITGGSQDFSIVVTGVYGNCAQNFTAVPTGYSQIDLNWDSNTEGDNTLLVWSTDNNFGIPTTGTTYSVNDIIPGGGTVLAYGSLNTFNHIDLIAGSTYYYKLYSHRSDNSYSNGKILHKTLEKGLPNNITISNIQYSSMDVQWEQNEENSKVLLAWSEDSNFGVPVDGYEYSAEENILGGGEVLYFGDTETLFNHINLNHSADYFYKLWSYIGNSYYSEGVSISNKTKILRAGQISGNSKVVIGSDQTYSIEPLPGMIYKWTLPEGWTGDDEGTTINIVVGKAGGNLMVTPYLNETPGVFSLKNITVKNEMIENFKEYGIVLYPNPSSGVFNLAFVNEYQNVKVEVVNTSGKIVYSTELITPSSHQVNISDQASGILIFKLTLDEETVNTVIILNKS